MSKMLKAFLCGTAVVALTLAGVACTHKVKPVAQPQQAATETKPPDIAIPTNTTPPTETSAPRHHLRPETTNKQETPPKQTEQRNQDDHANGYSQDAHYAFDAATLPS